MGDSDLKGMNNCVHGIHVRCISLHAASTIWCIVKNQLHLKVISPKNIIHILDQGQIERKFKVI